MMTHAGKKKGRPDETAGQLAFKTLFSKYYRPLTVFASTYVGEQDAARDIVQTVFLRLWENRERISIDRSEKSYLYQCVKNACYNHIASSKKGVKVDLNPSMVVVEDDVLETMIAVETRERIYKAIESLPAQCREIFKLSRIHQLKHAEIAEKLKLSEKTIENQVGIALKKLIKYRICWIMLLQLFGF